MTAYSVGNAIREAGGRLAGVAESGPFEARLLLGKTLSRSKEWLHANPEAEFAPERAREFENLVIRRARGCPLPYLLGEWAFYGRVFTVREGVLIPRPETELLVDHALAWAQMRNLSKTLKMLDVGTGSGCIAISLAAELPGSDVLGVDISFPALEVARENVERHRLANIRLARSDLLSLVTVPAGGFDLVCANLPYIPSWKLSGLLVADFEPLLALDGGPDGLALIRRLLDSLPGALTPGGLALLEIEAGQGQAVVGLARDRFPGAGIELHRDLAGRDRLVAVQT
ncbi:MAG TPA: peptide chain release factor N(5)-glutamine methyltransferase [Anaerolineales bacterium]|nr:peptide chain release factor N(5)-glutamine methyltransferase [Anaerolineales bacterium]